MAFGDEELMGLRAQLIAAGHEAHGHESPHGASIPASGSSTGGTGQEPARGPSSSDEPRERDEFLAMLGHELRNPLAPMQQAVELLQAHAVSEDPPYLRKARTVLVRQVEHFTRLVDVLLDADHRAAHAGGEGGVEPPRDVTAAEALIRRVAELHGGQVTAGGDGRELELQVRLPATPPEPAPAPPPAQAATPAAAPTKASPAASPERSRQILVVDDNEDAAEMLALVLRKRGFDVVLAFDGEEALTMAQAHEPEVVLLDIGLPGIDGYEVARRLRARPGPLVLVAVTGYGQPSDRQRSREAGFDHHLVKPVAMEKLLPLLEAAAG